MRKNLLVVFLVLFFLVVVGCSNEVPKDTKILPSSSPEEEEANKFVKPTGEVYQVVIESGKFMPLELVIKQGDTVEWVNNEFKEKQEFKDDDYDHAQDDPTGGEFGIEHTVTFENGDIDELLPPGGTVKYIFIEKGQFRYFDQFQPGMQGVIVVS